MNFTDDCWWYHLFSCYKCMLRPTLTKKLNYVFVVILSRHSFVTYINVFKVTFWWEIFWKSLIQSTCKLVHYHLTWNSTVTVFICPLWTFLIAWSQKTWNSRPRQLTTNCTYPYIAIFDNLESGTIGQRTFGGWLFWGVGQLAGDFLDVFF